VCGVPFQVKLLQATTVVSEAVLVFTVKCRVATESHPAAFVVANVYTPDAVYGVPFQVKPLQATTVVSDVVLVLIVRCRVATESQPAAFVVVNV
jgi:hypothetical protein